MYSRSFEVSYLEGGSRVCLMVVVCVIVACALIIVCVVDGPKIYKQRDKNVLGVSF